MSKGQLGGWVMIRPLRLGLLVADGPQALTEAVHHATSAWGGMYTPFINDADPDQAKQTADALSVDALRIVLRCNPVRLLISRIETPSRCSLRTSAHCSTSSTLPPRRSRTIQRESGPGRTNPIPRQVGHFSTGWVLRWTPA